MHFDNNIGNHEMYSNIIIIINANDGRFEDVVYTLLLENLIYFDALRGDPTARWQDF